MRFFSIRRLKRDLARRPLTTREIAQYLAAQGVLLSLLYIPTPAQVHTDPLFIVHPLLALAGVYYCYRRNGGALGERLAERFLAVGWVVGLRVATAAVLLTVTTALFLAVAGALSDWLESEAFTGAIDAGSVGLSALVYWRMGVHLADIRAQAAPETPSS